MNGKSALDELMRLKEQVKEDQEPAITKLEWKSPLQIIKYPDPILRAKNLKIRSFDESVKKLAQEMFEIMYQDDGVGLAAPQIGVNVRMMLFNETGDIEQKEKQEILINPYIVAQSKKQEPGREGCLSFPKILADVKRSTTIKVKAQTEEGKWIRREYSGLPAIIFQHEYDHLQGTLFHDRMEPLVLETVKDQLIAMEENFRRTNPGVDFQSIL